MVKVGGEGKVRERLNEMWKGLSHVMTAHKVIGYVSEDDP